MPSALHSSRARVDLRRTPSRRTAGGFMLLEIMLAVAVFSIAVLALGKCMSDCLDTQGACGRQERAILALQNRMVEVQANPVMPDEFKRTALKGMFSGLTMIERRRTLNIQNEDNFNLANLQEVSLSVEWPGPGGVKQASSVVFTLLRGQQ